VLVVKRHGKRLEYGDGYRRHDGQAQGVKGISACIVGSAKAAYSYYNAETDTLLRREKVSVLDYTAGIRMLLTSVTDPSMGVVSGVDEPAAIGFKTMLAKGYLGS